MDDDLACVNHRSISPQEVDIGGVAGQKHCKEVQETLADEDFLKLEESGKFKNNAGNANGRSPPTISLVEKFFLRSVGSAEETRLVKSAGYDRILVRPPNEAGQNDSVKSKGLSGKLKVEVIDETAVIECTSIPSGIGYRKGKMRPRMVENRGKRTRGRAKGGKQGLEANGRGKNVVRIVEVPKNESVTKKIYSRKEMEVLRYINPEEQRKMWMALRSSLGPVVLKEYDGLTNCINQTHIRLNFDPRRQSAKKEQAPAILGMVGKGNMEPSGNPCALKMPRAMCERT